MKKIIVCLLCIFILSGCETRPTDDGTRIALIISSSSNPFFASIIEYAEYECEKRDYDLIVLDSKDDLEVESDHFDSLSSYDAIIFNPVEGKGSSQNVLKANQAGVPIITLDRSVDEGQVITHIASDNYSGGRLAGEFIESVIRPEDKLLVLEGLVDTTANKMRIEGVTDYLSGVGIEVDQTLVANFSRQEAYELAILNDLSDINIIFAANDEMALGILDAMREKKTFAVIIGFDGTSEAVQAIKSGYMAATIAQQPDLLARYSVEAVEDILNKQEIDKEIYVALKLVSMLIK